MPLKQLPTDPDKVVYVRNQYDIPQLQGVTTTQRTWVDLTDEEITKTYWSREPFKRPTLIGFAREIEQLLKEKNTWVND